MANFIKLKADLIEQGIIDENKGEQTFYVNFDLVSYYYEMDDHLFVRLNGQEETQSFKSTLSDVNQQLKQNQIANYFKTS